MARKIFIDGDVLTATDVNQIAYPKLDGVDAIGSGDKLPDSDLSDAENQIKKRFYDWYDRFKPSVISGLELRIQSGVVNSGGTLITIPEQSIIVNNSNNYIYIGRSISDPTIALRRVDSQPTFNHIPVAFVVASGGVITVLNDLRYPVAEYLVPVQSNLVNPGDCIFSFIPGTAPQGYLECLGQLVSRTTYPLLFAAIGTTYGAGDGSTTFQLPDTRNLFFMGSDTVGVIGGNANHEVLITQANLPAHNHGIDPIMHTHVSTQTAHTHPIADGGHNHGVIDGGHHHDLPADIVYRGKPTTTEFDTGNEDDDFRYGIVYKTSNAVSNILIDNNQSGVTVGGQVANININAANHGIQQTKNTGNNVALNIKPRSINVRCFIKF